MPPSPSSARSGERERSPVDAGGDANNYCRREAENGFGIELTEMADEDPTAEPFHAVDYGEHINPDPEVPVPFSSYTNEGALHPVLPNQLLRNQRHQEDEAPHVEHFDFQTQYNGQNDALAPAERLDDTKVFGGIPSRPFDIGIAEEMYRGQDDASFLDAWDSFIEPDGLEQLLPNERPAKQIKQEEQEPEQRQHQNSMNWLFHVASVSRINLSSGVGDHKRQEEESEHQVEEDSELGFDKPTTINEAGEWQKRLISGRNPIFGPVNAPSQPAYKSPYAVPPVQQPNTTQSDSAEEPIIVSDSPVRLPSRPSPVLGTRRVGRVISKNDIAATQFLSQMREAGAAPTNSTSIAPFIPPRPVPAIPPFVAPAPAPTRGLTWASFVARSQASAANPAGFAAAHELIARTPYKTQGKNGPYVMRGPGKGDFLVFLRNGFITRYFRQFHPNRPVPNSFQDKNDWFNALPPRGQNRVRRFIQKKVEAELPKDVAAQVKRLRETRPTIASGGGANSGRRSAITTGFSDHGSTGRGAHATAASQGMSRRRLGGNATINFDDLQNDPNARMQDLADLDLRLGPAVQQGYGPYQPYGTGPVAVTPNTSRDYQQSQSFNDDNDIDDSIYGEARATKHRRT